MKLLLTNSITKNKEYFIPVDPSMIKMYVCGPTVYDSPHIGNARSIVVYDILYRILINIFGLDKVLYVRNITDVDDKIINKAQTLNIDANLLTENVIKVFYTDTQYLQCLSPNIEPRATLHILEMIDIIQRLIALGYAYIADECVYFDISKAQDYYKLSRRDSEQALTGVRVDIDKNKRNSNDFVLWKSLAKKEKGELSFDSPWGRGRPGWHIECSAMSYKYLGENFDIHGGGADLIFPHHTNEVAQSTCAFPKSIFAKYWVHNGFLTVNGEKMSKSLGNFITVNDLRAKGVVGEIVRLALLTTHYRKPLDFNDSSLAQATITMNYWYRSLKYLEDECNEEVNIIDLPSDFISNLYDDMNLPSAISIINHYAKLVYNSENNKEKKLYASYVLSCARFIGLLNSSVSEWFGSKNSNTEIKELVAQRTKAKEEKNWQLADEIRLKLLQRYNITLEDRKDGSTDIIYLT